MSSSGKRNKKVRIAVAMSGGVDSSLAAALLKRRSYDVIGLTFRMWPKEECGTSYGRTCCSLEAITRARAVAEDLGIHYYIFDLNEEFKSKVIDYFCEEYLRGRTPNPCAVCNEKIKFGLLWKKALSLDAGFLATGHYAKVSFDRRRDRFLLKEGRDRIHDQSYFLFPLTQEQLARTVFPLGDITKEKARSTARRMRLKTHDTPSSQDICFVRGMDYAEYIRKKTGVEIKEGEIVDTEGKVLGRHKGIPFYTIGQRRALGVAHREPLYVIAIDIPSNRIVVGAKKYILKKSLTARGMNWIAIKGIKDPLKVSAKIRYSHKKAPATVTATGPDEVRVDFDEPQEAPTPGQAVVFYDRDAVLGGGWIDRIKR